MLFESLFSRKNKKSTLPEIQFIEKRKLAQDRRKPSDRRSSVKPNCSGVSRRFKCVDRRSSSKDRRHTGKRLNRHCFYYMERPASAIRRRFNFSRIPGFTDSVNRVNRKSVKLTSKKPTVRKATEN